MSGPDSVFTIRSDGAPAAMPHIPIVHVAGDYEIAQVRRLAYQMEAEGQHLGAASTWMLAARFELDRAEIENKISREWGQNAE